MTQNTYPFTMEYINQAPNSHGVYILYETGAITYIGRVMGIGVTIRSRLTRHKNGDEGRCTQSAHSFWYEVTEAAAAREQELLVWYKKDHAGKLPACNDVMP